MKSASRRIQYSRRTFMKSAAVALAGGIVQQRGTSNGSKMVDTSVLSIGYEESGSPAGLPVILLHGFPDDVHAFDDVAPPLAKAGYRVLVPYLRGYGPTQFRDPAAAR